jgi:uncharacterized protein YgiM (DUF1202 family)
MGAALQPREERDRMKVRRNLIGLVCIVLALSLALAPLSVTAEKGKIYRATEGGVRIREKPQSGSTVIGKLHKGEKVIHLSTKNNWWKIKTSSGLTGYVFPSNLKYYRTYSVGNLYKASSSKGVKVYKKASSKAAVKGTLTRKYTVVLLAKSGDWGLIRVVKNGKVGYVPLKNLIAA